MTILLAPPAPSSQSDEQLLTAAVDRLLAAPSVGLPGPAALDRLRVVLVQSQRLTAVAADGVRDLDARQLFALDGAGSAAGWLRARRVGGQTAPVTFSRRVAARPLVGQTLAAGRLGARAAEQLCAALDRVPEQVEDATVRGVLLDGVPELLREARGAGPDLDAGQVAAVLGGAAAASGDRPVDRLEPAFVLLAEQLGPARLTRALGYLLDALLPEGHLARHERLHEDQHVDLHHLPGGGWHLTGLLDPETGQLLHSAIDNRLPAPEPGLPAGRRRAQALRQLLSELTSSSGASGTGSEAGPGRGTGSGGETGTGSGQGGSGGSTGGSGDASSAGGGTGTGSGRGPAGEPRLTVIAGLGALLGQPGALPGRLTDGTSLPREAVRRLGCGSALTAVLLDAAGSPVGASGTHRSATARERRALRAQWGERCAVEGCDRPGSIPHHVAPWWLAHRTRLGDLVPLCTSSHHDLHEGGRTLRLRDGRYISPTGWTTGPAP